MNKVLELIKSDYYALYGQTSLRKRIYLYFFNGGHPIRYDVWLRLAAYFKKRSSILFLFSWMMLRHYEFKYGVHVSTDLEIGPGLRIAHGDCVYIYPKKIGKNFTCYQGVTIGRTKTGVPLIGDDVTVYTGAKVIGGVSLGDGCVIAAGSVILDDVPAKALVAGIPGKIIKMYD